jgi:hypothetical protein
MHPESGQHCRASTSPPSEFKSSHVDLKTQARGHSGAASDNAELANTNLPPPTIFPTRRHPEPGSAGRAAGSATCTSGAMTSGASIAGIRRGSQPGCSRSQGGGAA